MWNLADIKKKQCFGYLEQISSGATCYISMYAKGSVVISITEGSAFARKCLGEKTQTAEFHKIHRSSSMEMTE